MKKSTSLIFISISLVLLGLSSCRKSSNVSKDDARQKEVIVYAYDSFVNEWGPGDAIIKAFEEKTGLTLTLVSIGDGGNIIAKVQSEKSSPVADIALGIDNNLAETAFKADIFDSYKPASFDDIFPEILLDKKNRLIPYDYSYFAIIWDSLSGVEAPKSLEDLTKPEYEKKLILMSPKTSTPGLGFALWTAAIYGKDYKDYWKRLNPSILTMSPSWSTGYGLFTQGEAPLVCSYTTSPAYHVEYDNTDRYKALIFDEGHIMQIEGAGILKNAPNRKGAEAFMDFLLSEEGQNILPLTQWMYPANKKVVLPECYNVSPKATKILSLNKDISVEEVQSLTY